MLARGIEMTSWDFWVWNVFASITNYFCWIFDTAFLIFLNLNKNNCQLPEVKLESCRSCETDLISPLSSSDKWGNWKEHKEPPCYPAGLLSFPLHKAWVGAKWAKQQQYVACSDAQSCLTLCDPVDCSPPGSSVHGISQARMLEWVVISFSRGSFQLRNQARVSSLAGGLFTTSFRWETPKQW